MQNKGLDEFIIGVANNVKELAFHTMIWLRSSPGIDKDTNMMMSNALNTTRTIPKKIIAPTGILFRSFLHMVVVKCQILFTFSE